MTQRSRKWSARIVTISFTTSLCLTSLRSSAVADPPKTSTPIEHLIVVVGENHSFDNIFATYALKFKRDTLIF